MNTKPEISTLNQIEKVKKIHWNSINILATAVNAGMIFGMASGIVPAEIKAGAMMGVGGLQVLAWTHYRLIWCHNNS